MKLKAITAIDDGQSQYPPGAVFNLPRKQAQPLIDCGAVEVVKLKAPVVDPAAEPETVERDPLTGLPTA